MPELNDLDSILASLPPDPTQGLEVLYKKLRERVTYASKVDRRSSIEEFIVCISAWVTTHYPDEYTPDIDYISSFNTEQIESVFSTTEDTAVSIIGRHKSNLLFQKVAAIASGDNNFVGWAKLRDSEKNILRQHVDKIKIIITSSDIDEKKKNALINKIIELEKEIERAGTRSDHVFGILVEVSTYAGKFAENAKPLINEVKDIIRLITRAKNRDEDLALPPGDDTPPLLEYTEE